MTMMLNHDFRVHPGVRHGAYPGHRAYLRIRLKPLIICESVPGYIPVKANIRFVLGLSTDGILAVQAGT